MRERGNKMTARNRKTAVEGDKEKGEEREREGKKEINQHCSSQD